MDDAELIKRLKRIETRIEEKSCDTGCLFPMVFFLFMIAMCSPHH